MALSKWEELFFLSTLSEHIAREGKEVGAKHWDFFPNYYTLNQPWWPGSLSLVPKGAKLPAD